MRLLNCTEIDCDTTGETHAPMTQRIGIVGENTIASVQASSIGSETAWSTAVLTIRWRISDEFAWQDFSPVLTITSGTPYVQNINVFGVPEIGAVVTTTQSGVRLRVGTWAEGSE